MKIHPSSNIAGLQREAEDRIAQNTRNIDHERSMELYAEDDMLDENGQVRKGRELPVGGRVYSMFMDMYRFACDRFGAENVVGACIHLDEYTPHMHVFVVPITMKEKRYAGKTLTDEDGNPVVRGTLDAKNIFYPKTTKQFWPDLAEHLKNYGVSKAEGCVPKVAKGISNGVKSNQIFKSMIFVTRYCYLHIDFRL